MREEFSFRAHPFYMLKILKRFIFVLIVPVVKAVIQYVFYRKVGGVLPLEAAALGGILLISAAKWHCFKISFDGKHLCIKDGVFFKKTALIPRENISSAVFCKHFFLDLTGGITVSINTEAGAYGKTDFSFKLYKKDAEKLGKAVYGELPQVKLVFPARKIALFSATATSFLTGILVGVPIINGVGKLLNISIARVLTDLTAASKRFKTYFPPAVNLFTLLFLAVYGISFLLALAKNMFFKVSADNGKISVTSGLYFHKTRIFRKKAVNNLCIDQTPLMRLFKIYTVRAAIGGYGGEKGERSTVLPSVKKAHIKRLAAPLFPMLSEKQNFICPQKSFLNKQRFLALPNIYFLVIIGASSLLSILFPKFDRLFLFCFLVLFCFNLYYARLRLYGYKNSKIGFGRVIAVKCTHRFTTREFYVAPEKVGKIKITRTPADRKLKTCRVKLTVRSESSDTAKVRNLPFERIEEEIFKIYGIKPQNRE